MPSRRQIREATIQFLYCSDLEGGAEPSALREPFWEFLTETDRRNLLVATFRTVHHLAHGRKDRLAEFIERSETATAHLSAFPQAEQLKTLLTCLLALESSWSLAFTRLERIPKDGEDADVAEEFKTALAQLFKTEEDLAFNRRQFLKGVEDFPSMKAHLEGVAASIRRLERISDRLRMVEHPEKFPEQADLSKLRQSKSEIIELRTETDQLVDAILLAKAKIDEKLAEIVENYTPERINPVDRAILRLGTYEILFTDIPPKAAINEAIELAKRFGTTDSRRFVNGMLDQVAKSGISVKPEQ
ncbi:transcription antitermination factor NusB [Luteolibacter algae]|uniref:Transcription antitermination protein NusB n=1 Tax=Luteolibacter algae TaxID=454151 RepID=A0ABW5D999_9BACT